MYEASIPFVLLAAENLCFFVPLIYSLALLFGSFASYFLFIFCWQRIQIMHSCSAGKYTKRAKGESCITSKDSVVSMLEHKLIRHQCAGDEGEHDYCAKH